MFDQGVTGKGLDLDLELTFWQAVDSLRSTLELGESKHVVLGLIFLRFLSTAFEEQKTRLQLHVHDGADPEDPDEYTARNVVWVPQEARWSNLEAKARQPEIGQIVDDAMRACERDNPSLRGALPKDYSRVGLDKQRLGQLIDLISNVGVGADEGQSGSILAHLYESFCVNSRPPRAEKVGTSIPRATLSNYSSRSFHPSRDAYSIRAAVPADY